MNTEVFKVYVQIPVFLRGTNEFNSFLRKFPDSSKRTVCPFCTPFLNALSFLNIYKYLLDGLDLLSIANDFDSIILGHS